MRLLPLVGLIFLPVVLCTNNSFKAIILGLERDCINYYCRYTGRLYGHFWQPYKILPPEVKIKPCVTLRFEYCTFKTVDECNERSKMWRSMCPIWSTCPNYEYCNDQSIDYKCSCKKGSPYTFAVNLFANDKLRNNFFRLVFVSQTMDYDKPYQILASSNIFDIRTRPADWNPIYLNGKKEVMFWGSWSVNPPRAGSKSGSPPLRAGTMCVLMGTVFAIGLATLLF